MRHRPQTSCGSGRPPRNRKNTMANDEKEMSVAAVPPALVKPRVAVGAVDHDRVKAQMRRWQDRVLDLTKSNPLIGLNRSRVTKLRVTSPDAVALFSSIVVDEA